MPHTVHHLDKKLYSEPKNIFLIHIGLRGRREAFVGEVVAKSAGLLKAYLAKHTIPVHAWIFLTSRLSLVIQPTKEKSIFTIADELQKLIKKQALPNDAEFFGDFLDHLLRKPEDPKLISAELLLQCVEANLASSPKEYPYCGSTIYPIHELANQESIMLESRDLSLNNALA